VTEVKQVLGIDIPEGVSINVFGWKWTGAEADRLSLAAYHLVEHTAGLFVDREKDVGVGVYRSRVPGESYDDSRYLFVVDVNLNLLGRTALASKVGGDRYDPPAYMAQSLALRHIKQAMIPTAERGGGRYSSKVHHGLGMLLDSLGEGRTIVGQG